MPTSVERRVKPLARLFLGLEWAPHFDEWETLASKHSRLLLLASRDHAKTTFFSQLVNSVRAILYPGTEMLLMSYADKQIIKIITGIKDWFEKVPQLRQLMPKGDDDWSKGVLKFSNGSRIDSLTFGSSGRGGHYDIVTVDDPVKDYGGMDPEEQEDYFKRAVTPMVKPGGQMMVLGNYVYDGDLIERIEKNPAYHVAKYPAITDGRPLWPSRWPLRALDERRIEVGEYAFSREYLLQKVSLGTGFFRRDRIKFYDPENIPERMYRILSVDPALSADGDYSALVVTGTAEDGKTYILDHSNIRTDDVQKVIDEIFRLQKLHQVSFVQVETIGFQKLLKHWLYDEMREKNQHFGIEEIRTHNKSKQARIMALQPRIEAGSLLFHPSKDEDIIGQLVAFPHGSYDDLIDSLCFQVGKWDKPGPMEVKAPQNSFDWWKGQAKPVDQDWAAGLNL